MVSAGESSSDRRSNPHLTGTPAAMWRVGVTSREFLAVASMLAAAPRAWWRKDRMPLPDLVRSFEREPTSRIPAVDPARLVVLTSSAFRRLGIRDFCVPLSLLSFSRLTGWGYAPEIVFGVARYGDRLHGHAWIEIDGKPVGEGSPPEEVFQRTFSYSSADRDA